MKLAINLDDLSFVNPTNPRASVNEVSMRRDDVLPLEVIFFKGGERCELSSDHTGSIQVNEKDEFGGSGLASDASFTKAGTGVDSIYNFDLDLSVAAVDTAFTNASNPSSIEATLEIKITDGTHTERTAPLAVRLENSIAQS